jgi:hypothetical protein
MARTERDDALAMANKWEREASELERSAGDQRRDWNPVERKLMGMHARVKRGCAQELKLEMMKVRRG